MTDFSKLSDAELSAIASGNFGSLSDATLQMLAGSTTASTPAPAQADKPSAFARGMGMAARAMAPTLTGIAAGSPAGPAGMIAGGLLIPAADAYTGLINLAASPFTEKRMIPTSQAIQNLMTAAGVPAPESEQTSAERVVSKGVETLTGVGTQVPQLAKLATTAATPMARSLAQQMSVAPGTQAVVAPTAAMAGQGVYEATDNPIASFLTTLGTSLVGGLKMPKTQQAVSEDAMARIAKDRYQTLDAMGFKLKSDEFVADMKTAVSDLRKEGYTPKGYPKVAGVVEELTSSTQPKDWTELQGLRKMIRGAQKSIDPEEKRLGSILMDKFDDYLMKLNPSNVETGDAKLFAKNWADARDSYAKMKKSEIFTDMLEDAKIDKNKFTQSGAENSMATQLRQLAKNDKRMAMFTSEERDAITKAAEGDTTQNLLRFFGKFAPTGVFTGAGAGGLIAYDPFTGTILTGGAMASRYASTKYRTGTIEDLANQMRTGAKPEVIQGRTAALPALATRAGLDQAASLFGQIPGIDILRERRIREMQANPQMRGLLSGQ